MKKLAIDRFTEKVAKKLVVVDGKLLVCWIWTSDINHAGYGKFWFEGKSVRAHVWSYEHFIGPVPDGMELDHFKCKDRACVNPDHVRPATHLDNVRNGLTHNAVKTHCAHGHELTPENTRHINRSRGGIERVCKVCERRREREYRQRKHKHG